MRVIKSDVLDNFLKDKNGSKNNEEQNILIAEIETKYGTLNRSKNRNHFGKIKKFNINIHKSESL